MAWPLEQFRSWALSQGQVGKYDDGQYRGECVSLINQYCYRVLDVPAKAWGHAKDWASNAAPLAHFDKVSNVQAGDILVYPATSNNAYGHIEIALGHGQALGQNRHFDYRIRQAALLGGYIAVLRKKGTPKGGDMVTNEDQLNRLYDSVLRRPRGAGEGNNVYLGKDSGFVFDDLYKSVERKDRIAADAGEKAALVSQVNTLNSQVNQLTTDKKNLNAVADATAHERDELRSQLAQAWADLTAAKDQIAAQLTTGTGVDQDTKDTLKNVDANVSWIVKTLKSVFRRN